MLELATYMYKEKQTSSHMIVSTMEFCDFWVINFSAEPLCYTCVKSLLRFNSRHVKSGLISSQFLSELNTILLWFLGNIDPASQRACPTWKHDQTRCDLLLHNSKFWLCTSQNCWILPRKNVDLSCLDWFFVRFCCQ